MLIQSPSIDPSNKYIGLHGPCLNPYLTELLTHGDQIARRKHWRTHLGIDWLQYVLQWMSCAMHDYKYELDERALWWWRWLWRWKWRRLGFVDEDDDEGVLTADDALPVLVLLTFWWGPLYKSCTGGWPASVSTQMTAQASACGRMECRLWLWRPSGASWWLTSSPFSFLSFLPCDFFPF